MMLNILQKTVNLILLFVCLISLVSCSTSQVVQHQDIPEEKKVEIAIFMPQSGPHAAVGKEYATLIKMGLQDGLQGNVNITSYDVSDEKTALDATNKAIKRNTKIILGPLTSPLTAFIAPKVKDAGIIIITLSNDPTLADDQLFVFGHAPGKQLKPLFDYFFDNQYKNFITLLPAGAHSQNVNKIIQNMIISHHGTLVRAEFYADTGEGISNSVKIVADSVDNINEIEEDNLRKVVIYLGDDPLTLKMVFEKIKALNLDKKAIIAGDNRIDFDDTNQTNIIFSGSLNILNTNIKERAKRNNIHYITFMHAIAYDAGKMTTEYLGIEFIPARFLSRLNSKVPYPGISGNIYFASHIAQRQYDIISRENNTQENNKYNTLFSAKIKSPPIE